MDKIRSSEDYLERILMLKKKYDLVRAVDIAHDMGFSKPSVSIALKKLKNNSLITVDDSTGAVELTLEGIKIAKSVLEKHEVITTCLIAIGVSEDVALNDACKIEHCLSDESFEKLRDYYYNNIKLNK